MNRFRAQVIQKEQLTHKIVDLRIKLMEPREIDFQAGQFVGFIIGEKLKRFYSITSLPESKEELSFCIDVSSGGEGSQFVVSLKAGDMFDFDGPHGVFTVKDFERPLVFVATGAGVAPFKSIIPDLLSRGYSKEIFLLFGVRDQSDIFFEEYFNMLADRNANFKFCLTLSRPSDPWSKAKGRVTDYLESNIENFKKEMFYLCGSPEMVKDTRALIISKGVDIKSIKMEVFT